MKRTSLQILTLLLTVVALMTGATANGAITREETRTANNRVIYEVFVRNFSPEGNLRGVEAQIPRLKELGIDVIWLMPIYTPGVEGRWGTYSSPYAVRDYKGIDPDYGTAADLHSLVNTIHANGMEVWLDWVANHTAMDHSWVSQHREYYGGNPYHPNGWNDVYQLDYSCEALRSEMIDALKYWVSEFDIDGYRCDYAEGVPVDFWERARREVNAVKGIAWLAESGAVGSHTDLVRNAFDYSYAWGFHDNLLDFARSGNVESLKNYCNALVYDDDAKAHAGKSRMVYLSNHDVVQDKGGTEDVHFHKYLRPLTVLQFTVYGMPLLYNGQEIQYRSGKVMLAEKTPINWNNPDTQMNDLIKTLIKLKHTEPALNTSSESADLINHTTNNSSVYVYERRRGNESVVVMLNLGDSQASFEVSSQLPANTYNDIFTGNTVDFGSTRSFTLPAQGYAVYVKGEGQPIETKNYTIRFHRPSTWTNTPNVHVYYHDETQDKDFDLINSQPMTAVAGTSDMYEYPFYNARDGYNVMFNNGGWSNGQSADSFYEPKAGNYTYTLDSQLKVIRDDGQTPVDPVDPVDPVEKRYVYVNDQTGWETIRLYAWSGNGGAEIFGAWPGAEPSGTTTINGISYLTFEVPESAWGNNYNLIVNNGRNDSGKLQLDDVSTSFDENVFIDARYDTPTPSSRCIFVTDNTGWEKICIYAWGNGQAQAFGGWPGLQLTERTTINGVTYLYCDIPDEFYDMTYNLIVNNGSQQLADVVVTFSGNIFITANPNGATTGIDDITVEDNNTAAEYYNLNGIRVYDPTPGIYICRRGTKVEKIVIR